MPFRLRKNGARKSPNSQGVAQRKSVQHPDSYTRTVHYGALSFAQRTCCGSRWLHDDAPAPRLPEATTGYWNFTKHRLLQGLRTGNKKEIETLVSELDPDAVNRDDGKVLAGDDAVCQMLINIVFLLINPPKELRKITVTVPVFVCSSREA